MSEETTTEKPVDEASPPTEENLPETAGSEEMLSDQEINSIQTGKASPLDPDFIIILIFAAFLDLAIDPLIETVGLPTVILPIVNRVIDIGALIIIGGWIYYKSKQFSMPANLAQKVKNMESKVMIKIQEKIQKKIASKALRKALLRAGGAAAVEMVPGIAVFTSWVAAVFSMVL